MVFSERHTYECCEARPRRFFKQQLRLRAWPYLESVLIWSGLRYHQICCCSQAWIWSLCHCLSDAASAQTVAGPSCGSGVRSGTEGRGGPFSILFSLCWGSFFWLRWPFSCRTQNLLKSIQNFFVWIRQYLAILKKTHAFLHVFEIWWLVSDGSVVSAALSQLLLQYLNFVAHFQYWQIFPSICWRK